MTIKSVAFIGLGLMGFPMARNLTEADVEVFGFDLQRAAGTHGGIQFCSSACDAVRQSDVVILMLPDGKIVEQVIFGNDGIISGLDHSDLVIDMSSSAPEGSKSIASRLGNEGVGFLDAPVSGGVKKAISGELAIMVGGEINQFSRAKSTLQIMGSKIFHVGEAGAGHATKALNNLLSAVGLVASFEVMSAAQKSGIDPHKFLEVINASTGRNNTTEAKMEAFVLSREFNAGFGLSLMVKDIETALEHADGLDLPMTVSKSAVALCQQAQQMLGEDADHTAVAKLIEQQAGILLGSTKP